MARRRVPKMCHHRPSGRAYVTDPASRRQVPLGRWGTPEAEAAYGRWVAEFLSRPAGVPAPRPGAAVTVDQLCEAYLAHARAYYRKGGRETSEVKSLRAVMGPLSDLYGTTPARDFGPSALRAVREQFVAAGWCRAHVNAQVHRLRRIFRWGVEQEMVPGTVLPALGAVQALRKGRTPAPDRPPVQPVPWAVVEATLPQLRPRWRVLVQVHYLAAMRAQDVVALRSCDIDRTTEPWAYRPHSYKTEHLGRPRVIFLGPRCRELLTPLLGRAKPADWLFPGTGLGRARTSCGHVTVSGYKEAVARACMRAGVEHWSPARLRHTALTEVRRLYGLEAAQVAGGHAHAATTEIYAQTSADLARKVASERG